MNKRPGLFQKFGGSWTQQRWCQRGRRRSGRTRSRQRSRGERSQRGFRGSCIPREFLRWREGQPRRRAFDGSVGGRPGWIHTARETDAGRRVPRDVDEGEGSAIPAYRALCDGTASPASLRPSSRQSAAFVVVELRVGILEIRLGPAAAFARYHGCLSRGIRRSVFAYIDFRFYSFPRNIIFIAKIVTCLLG